MFLLRPSARTRVALAVVAAVTLLMWPESRATTVAAAQRQAVGAAVPRDPQPRSTMRRTAARAEALREARARHLDHIPGEVLVKFRNGFASSVRRQRALSALSSRPSVNDLEWHGDVALLRQRMDADVKELARTLAAQPEVEYAEPNYLLRLDPLRDRVPLDDGDAHPAGIPNDQFYSEQWNFIALDMPRVWDINPGASADIVVAVVDSGVTTVNQSFSFPLWNGSAIQTVSMPFTISPGMAASRLTRPSDQVFGQTVLDLDGHGTHVASTIAETTNDMAGVAGIAYNAVIMPVKVCTGYWDEQIDRSRRGIPGRASEDDPGCATSDIADGIRYAADQGAKVINLSLGGPNPTSTVRDALQYAVQRGVFVSISMGNSFEDGNPTNYPAKYAETFPGVMAVAAVGRSMSTRATYSSTGTHCEIAAPGGDFEVDGRDGLIWQTTLFEPSHTTNAPVFNRFDVFGSQGTSMSAPHVSGLAALLMSQRPGITPAQIESIIRATARDIGAPGKDDEFGYGLIQPRSALFGLGIRR
jgi:subtilisin family serine protease